jgi:hypothetical protein
MKLIKKICEQLETDIAALIVAARATYEAATNEESKPENEYDTRGLEASYLAGAQAKRVVELEELLSIFRHLEPRSFGKDDRIATTALIEVDLRGKHSFVLLMPKGGGLILPFEGQAVQIVTPISPLGEALVGLRAGDTAVIEVGGQVREYDILTVQ